jgi:hypothetical protein
MRSRGPGLTASRAHVRGTALRASGWNRALRRRLRVAAPWGLAAAPACKQRRGERRHGDERDEQSGHVSDAFPPGPRVPAHSLMAFESISRPTSWVSLPIAPGAEPTGQLVQPADPGVADSAHQPVVTPAPARSVYTAGRLVRRVRDEQDRRRNVVALTPRGTAALKRLDRRVDAAQDALLELLSAADRRKLRRLLEQLVDGA